MIGGASPVVARRIGHRCAALVLVSLGVALVAPRAVAQLAVPADSSATADGGASRDTVRGVPHDEAGRSSHPFGERPFVGAWAAASRHASFRTRLGTRYHDLYLMGMRVGWTISRHRNITLDYLVNVIPLAIMEGNPEYRYVDVTPPCPPGGVCQVRQEFQLVPTYHSVYGFGLAPLGVQLRLFARSPVQLLVHVNGGALWFARPVPDPKATHFNFTAEGGGAVQWWITSRQALSVGYEFHHTSNAATGDVNPGLNSEMLTIGLTRGRK